MYSAIIVMNIIQTDELVFKKTALFCKLVIHLIFLICYYETVNFTPSWYVVVLKLNRLSNFEESKK